MILLLGSHGYIGSEFQREIVWRRLGPVRLLGHQQAVKLSHLNDILCDLAPRIVINCAVLIPQHVGRLCDDYPAETLDANVLLPSRLAHVCEFHGIPFAHVSTGCLWNDGAEHSENDPPQRSFNGHCGFYIGQKVLADQEVRKYERHFIWRIRLPFDEEDTGQNYLSKLMRYGQVWDQRNSVSHRGDFVKACLDLWQKDAPYGTYNIVNRGSIKATDIVDRMLAKGMISKLPQLLKDQPGECRLSVQKLTAAGVSIRTAEEAVEESLNNWKPQP